MASLKEKQSSGEGEGEGCKRERERAGLSQKMPRAQSVSDQSLK